MKNKFVKQLETRHSKVKSKLPRIAWLFTDWNMNQYRTVNDLYGGIGYYRVIAPARALRKWFDIEVIGSDIQHWGTMDETYSRLGRDYDLIISKHIMNGQTASNTLATAQHYKRKVLVDMDDNYFEIRKDNPVIGEYSNEKSGKYYLSAFLELANGITTSTDPLKQAYLKLNKKIDVLPNCVDLSDWGKPKKWNDGKIRIGYTGGTAHNEDLDLIVEPIARILQKYDNVIFEVLGALSVEKAMEMGTQMLKFGGNKILDRFRFMGGTPAWEGYPELLLSSGWDIGIAPLVDDAFSQSKSHIKWLEYSMIGAATIASPVHPYLYPIQDVKVIEHGKTGYFATTPESWYEHLELLIENEKVRKEMATNAYKYIKENWTYEKWAPKWRDVINKYL